MECTRTLLVLVLVLHRNECLVKNVLHLRELLALLSLALALQRQAVARASPADGGEHETHEEDADRTEDDQIDEQLSRVARQEPRRVLALQTRVCVRAPANCVRSDRFISERMFNEHDTRDYMIGNGNL